MIEHDSQAVGPSHVIFVSFLGTIVFLAWRSLTIVCSVDFG